jgi:UDP-N-acetylglucosamine--N-acetylmuramyl-(pentapeptide) pyrophosphoryl-undecaprenol N-acetylglucosamine transferase
VSDRAGSVFAVVAGGGTAGHVLPGLAVTRALGERGRSVHYVGAARGIEAELVPAAGVEHTLLPGRGIQRRFAAANLAAAWGILRAVASAIRLVRRLRPKVILALGGYASFPCVVAALLWRVPIVVAEQNTHPGVANRFAGRFARAAAVAFPGTPLPRATVTGNPIRPEIAAVDRSAAGMVAARRTLGLPADRRVVLVAGGSLGARSLNEAAVGLAEAWRDRTVVAIRHVVGRRDWAEISEAAPAVPEGQLVYQQVEYETDMPTALAAADVGVFRSGSSMCFEIAAAGLPSVLVPSPHVTGDHQTGNARWLADADAAVMVADAELTPDRLASELDALLDAPERREAMAEALRHLARPDAAAAIADLLEAHARA